jgi:hypothetical protein
MRGSRPLMAAAALCAALSAQAEEPAPQKEVVIKGLKDPELRAFRSVTVGLDTFDAFHAMAPAVGALRFKLKPRESTEDKSFDTITLRIVGDSDPIAVPIEADGGFTVARNQKAYDENAELIFNRKRRQFSSIADIRTPGVPQGARRLGDLRLECKVNVAIIKTEIPFWMRAMVNSLLVASDWCKKLAIFMSVTPEMEAGKATLVYGERRRELRKGEWNNGYESPLLDPAWPDDALVEFEPAEAKPAS